MTTTFLDLGSSPPSNAYLTHETLSAPEQWFPLKLLVCEICWLVQTDDYAGRDALFTEDYAYFSSTSTTWLAHAQAYIETVAERFDLGQASKIVEVASNDGYFLQFAAERGIPCLGIEPTKLTAEAARQKGLEVVIDFFGTTLASELVSNGHSADLTVANNVLAHVPDINDFVSGFARLLKPAGVATFEFPHLLNMIEQNQFDTAYHEHFSYLSLKSVENVFASSGLTVFDVEELSTHGGSLRVYAQRADSGVRPESTGVAAMRAREEHVGISTREYYSGYQAKTDAIKDALVTFLIESRRSGLRVGAYGAAAKGNTILNYAGVRPDLLPYVVDRSPGKVGRFMPGSRIPIVTEDILTTDRPDFVLILPWNLKSEIEHQLEHVRVWGARFVTAIPQIMIW